MPYEAKHLEILAEEPSLEAALNEILPRMLGQETTFAIHAYQGKPDLLKKPESRLRAYAKWLPQTARIVVLVDRDNDDCRALKRKLEKDAAAAGLGTRSAKGSPWQIVSRIAIEELEAWFFGDWAAVRGAFPKVSSTIPNQTKYRKPDAVAGGIAEALERILQRAGYFETGLRKIEAAVSIGKFFDPARALSPSFISFREALMEAIS
jgi:hypothetical protein